MGLLLLCLGFNAGGAQGSSSELVLNLASFLNTVLPLPGLNMAAFGSHQAAPKSSMTDTMD